MSDFGHGSRSFSCMLDMYMRNDTKIIEISLELKEIEAFKDAKVKRLRVDNYF